MGQDFEEFRPVRVWKRMSPEQRLRAAEPFWKDEQSTDQQVEAIAAIASHMKFRTKSVLNLSAEKRIKYLASLPTISDSIAARALVAYHLEQQRPMMAAFLDSLGVAHEDGVIADETVAKPAPEKLAAAAQDLGAKFPAEDVSLYFATLISQDPATWGELHSRQSLVGTR
jgi:beta-phosphoglucomutase-like phosphatase (HAD superfamily)